MAYWLFKTEPDAFSIDDLHQTPEQSTFWEEIHNYQARNFLRDDVQVGAQVFIYQSPSRCGYRQTNQGPAGLINVRL